MNEDRRKKLGIPNFGGNLVLSGYDTERDLNKAKQDIERMLRIVASESVYNIMKFLAPYRAEMAKREELEYDDLTLKEREKQLKEKEEVIRQKGVKIIEIATKYLDEMNEK